MPQLQGRVTSVVEQASVNLTCQPALAIQLISHDGQTHVHPKAGTNLLGVLSDMRARLP